MFANGRRIAAIQKVITDTETFGCELTFTQKLKYISYPVIVANMFILAVPIMLIVIVRGVFFQKSWRGKRGRNILIILLVCFFIIGPDPLVLRSVEMTDSEITLCRSGDITHYHSGWRRLAHIFNLKMLQSRGPHHKKF